MKKILDKIAKALSQISEVKAVILYGSFARGEATSRSDIDLLILTGSEKLAKDVEDEIIRLEHQTGRTIQPTIRTPDELHRTDTGLLQNIFQEGKVLYARGADEIPSAVLLKQKPFLLYTFHLKNLDQNEKAKFNRRLYKQEKKEYEYKGFLHEIGGLKVSAGCILVPYSEKQAVEKFFRKFKISFNQQKIWK